MGRLHLIIKGRVQGVFFRASVQELAQSLDLTGWVRNRIDDSVELVAEGAPEKLSVLRSWSQHGPSGAVVEQVDEIAEKETGEFSRFYVRGSM
ncbi:MAG TPA: acylphosphatase [Candidatus Eremiobacteraceae bacterium]|nr:acylphosphatase [Candidatus Eremiobacteraceae bacterium]